MRRRHRQGFFTLTMQLFGLESAEQSLIDARLALGHRVERMQLRAYRVLPIVAVSVALVLYAAGAVTLTVRKLRAAAPAKEAEPADGEPSVERTDAELTEAVQVAV
ncbi:MAG: hypothetical protein ACRDJE_16460 [Dehalococcoidia bacterium]